MFILSFVNGRAMVAGRNTAADGIIKLAGAVNAIAEYEGYKQINDEAAIAARPDAVLVMKRSSRRASTPEEVFKHPALSATPAAATQGVRHRWMGSICSGFGPRTARAARDLAARSIPRLANGALPSEQSEPSSEDLPAMTASRLPAQTPGRPRVAAIVGRRPCGQLVLPALAACARGRDRRAIGAAGIPAAAACAAALGLVAGDPDAATLARDRLVLWSIRLPRIALAIMIGGLLAASGAIMQGLFRNPLADPALVGVSSGGALAAAATIVIGDRMLAGSGATSAVRSCLPLAAFVGALVATLMLYRIATREDRTSIVDLPSGRAGDRSAGQCRHRPAGVPRRRPAVARHQLLDARLAGRRDLAEGQRAIAPFAARSLARHPVDRARARPAGAGRSGGVPHAAIEVERLKRICHRAGGRGRPAPRSRCAGVIGFVGIVVPHLLRIVIGPGHRLLLPASMLLGAMLLLVADTLARTLAAPAEVPIGIVTAVIGAPFFLSLLLRQRTSPDL